MIDIDGSKEWGAITARIDRPLSSAPGAAIAPLLRVSAVPPASSAADT